MPVIVLYAVTAAVFLLLDAIMLRFVMQPLFRRHLGDQLLDSIRLAPAVAFYALYIAGLVWLVSLPALRSGAAVWGPAAVIGFMAYGTYEFTSFAVMRNWHWQMVAMDVAWGTALTAVSAAAGVWVVGLLGLGGAAL